MLARLYGLGRSERTRTSEIRHIRGKKERTSDTRGGSNAVPTAGKTWPNGLEAACTGGGNGGRTLNGRAREKKRLDAAENDMKASARRQCRWSCVKG